MVQFTRAGLAAGEAPADLEQLRREFGDRHCIRLRRLLAGDLLALVRREVAQAAFVDRAHGTIGLEGAMQFNAAFTLLSFVSNDPRFFGFVERVTGCGRIAAFVGRVYRMVPGTAHYDSWHSDTIGDRLIGMSINLSPEVYGGGVFQLRDRASKAMIAEAPNTGEGDAILFRIDEALEHRVTPLEGSATKTAFAGWFVSKPDFLSMLAGNGTDG